MWLLGVAHDLDAATVTPPLMRWRVMARECGSGVNWAVSRANAVYFEALSHHPLLKQVSGSLLTISAVY